MKVEFLVSAEIEFYEAIAFYNLKRDGLGFEFKDEVKATIDRIKESPESWAPYFPFRDLGSISQE